MTKLRKSVIVISFLLICFTSFSQTDSCCHKFEIGLGYAIPPPLAETNYFPNITFKIVKNKNAIRFGTSYDQLLHSLTKHTWSVYNVGYERRFYNVTKKRKTKILTGADICYMNKFDSFNNKFVSLDYVSLNLFGVGPVLGFVLEPIKRLSLQTEVGIIGGFGTTRQYNNGQLIKKESEFTFGFHRFFSVHFYYCFN
jgi:hypothetical protein